MTGLEFSREIDLKKIPQNGMRLREHASDEELSALARRYKLDGILQFQLEAEVTTWRKKGIQVAGTVSASIRQSCVVTLEAFEQVIEEPFSTLFLPAGMIQETDDPEADVPEAMTDGVADVGELAVQVLALGIDPHPRKPDAEFLYQTDSEENLPDETDNPFHALKRLHKKG